MVPPLLVSCESFVKTLEREEIYANQYHDLEDLRAHIEGFIENYYNRQRLHSALGVAGDCGGSVVTW